MSNENCDRRCHLCGEFGGDDSIEPLAHPECWEADRAGRDIPVGEAARAAWRSEAQRYQDDYCAYCRRDRCGCDEIYDDWKDRA